MQKFLIDNTKSITMKFFLIYWTSSKLETFAHKSQLGERQTRLEENICKSRIQWGICIQKKQKILKMQQKTLNPI